MKLDAALLSGDPREGAPAARRLEELGFDGAFTFEGRHDPFLPVLPAAAATRRLELYTAVAIALARSPMTLAYTAWDLNLASRGRFLLGLGTQIRPHIERRYSMPWSRPAARMREMVLALRAIWSRWQHGEKLDFRGEFYTVTLSTPVFEPGPSPQGPPRILCAGVGPRMTAVAGEVADGFLVHPFHTPSFLRERSLAWLGEGLARAGRGRERIEVACQVIVATGRSDEELERAQNGARAQISFYASTPAYRPVLEHLGCGPLQEELRSLSLEGRWLEMAGRIGDDLLDAIAVCGPPEEIPAKLADRYAGLVDRLALVAPLAPKALEDAELVAAIRRAFAAASGEPAPTP